MDIQLDPDIQDTKEDKFAAAAPCGGPGRPLRPRSHGGLQVGEALDGGGFILAFGSIEARAAQVRDALQQSAVRLGLVTFEGGIWAIGPGDP